MSREALELAQQVEPVLDLIQKRGGGEGEITIKVSGGKFRRFFDFAGRWFFSNAGSSADDRKDRS